VIFISTYFQTEPSGIYLSYLPNEERGCEGEGMRRMEKRRPSHLTVN